MQKRVPGETLEDIGKKLGLSKGSITGRIRRLKEQEKNFRLTPFNGLKKPPQRKPPTPPPKLPDADHPTAPPLTPIKESQCPYVFGEPFKDKWAFCGRPSVGGKWRWCETHLVRVMISDKRPRDAKEKAAEQAKWKANNGRLQRERLS